MDTKPLVSLSMIVKNEEKSIESVLTHASNAIDYAVIVDTGSTDRTKEIARKTLEKLRIPYEIHDIPFVDFATTRNEALKLSKQRARFSLILSGDETLVGGDVMREALRLSEGMFDIYCMQTILVNSQVENAIVRVFWSGCNAHYVGAIHEVAAGYDHKRAGFLPSQVLYDDSWESNPELRERRYTRDVAIIRESLARGELVPKMITYLIGYMSAKGNIQEVFDTYKEHEKEIESFPVELKTNINIVLMRSFLAQGNDRKAYEKLNEICKDPRFAKEALYEYALFLWKNRRFEEALELANLCVTVPVFPLTKNGSRDIGVTTWKPHWLVASCAHQLGMNDICEKAAANAAYASGYAPKVMEQLSHFVDITRAEEDPKPLPSSPPVS